MVVVLDTTSRPRHPEKAHRPDTPTLKKPDWIRVKAPVSPGYAATRRFYEAIAFEPIEVFPALWGPDNPCLLMLKGLS